MKEQRRRYKEEAASGYYYCRVCSKRISKSDLVVWDGLYYHKSCHSRLENMSKAERNKKAKQDNSVYYEMLRKQWGLPT